MANNSVVSTITTNGPATWNWDGTTLTGTGLLWATSYLSSNPQGNQMISEKVTDLTITTGGSPATNATSYECIEGVLLAAVYESGCKNTNFNFSSTFIEGYLGNLADDSTAAWMVGGNPKCVTETMGGDDYSLFDGNPGPFGGPPVAGTPSPRGLTAQAAGEAGAGCAQTAGTFDLPYVIRDDATYLILANVPVISNTSAIPPQDPRRSRRAPGGRRLLPVRNGHSVCLRR